MQYADWMAEAPADAPMMTPAEWTAYQPELQDRYDNPGHDATPYCQLCDEDGTPDEPLVDTTFGPMHQACADSHEEIAE